MECVEGRLEGTHLNMCSVDYFPFGRRAGDLFLGLPPGSVPYDNLDPPPNISISLSVPMVYGGREGYSILVRRSKIIIVCDNYPLPSKFAIMCKFRAHSNSRSSDKFPDKVAMCQVICLDINEQVNPIGQNMATKLMSGQSCLIASPEVNTHRANVTTPKAVYTKSTPLG